MASLAWAALFALSVSALRAPISDFDISCYEESDKGETYKGLMTKTSSGRTCQNWLKDKPHSISMSPSDANGLGNHNYCRNPDGSEDKPGATQWIRRQIT